MTLTEFLLARIAEDEALASAATSGPWVAAPYMPEQTEESFREWYDSLTDGAPVYELTGPGVSADDVWPIWARADAEHIARHDPARVLAECEAKRRIVELHEFDPNYGACWICALKDGFKHSDGWGDEPWPCSTIRILALPYADHPDWREEWRP